MQRGLASISVLPSYPLTYYPTSFDELFEDTRKLIDDSDLGVFLFAIDQWNFARLHPAGFPIEFLERLAEACPNLAGIKNEVGLPYAGGLTDVFDRFRGRLLITDPLEHNAPIWIRNYGMRFMGTSNYESMADRVPRMLELLSEQRDMGRGYEDLLASDAGPPRRDRCLVGRRRDQLARAARRLEIPGVADGVQRRSRSAGLSSESTPPRWRCCEAPRRPPACQSRLTVTSFSSSEGTLLDAPARR